MDEDEETLSCKVVLIGQSAVGKTNIIYKFVLNKFNPNHASTLGASFLTKNVLIGEENKGIKYEIWDTAGQERYRALTKVFYKNATVCILVYDITRRASFEEIKDYWVKEIKDNTPPDIGK